MTYKPGETFEIWTYVTNTDLTEGRGQRVYGTVWFENRYNALIEGVDKGVQGTSCESVQGLGIMDLHGLLHVIGHPGKISQGEPSAKALQNYQALCESKLRASKLTPDDLAMLGYFPRQK